jgi:hypothetical protein
VAIVIKADCPECGVVRLSARDLTVRVCTDDGSAAYCFRCTRCGSAVNQDASPPVSDRLVAAGVKRVEWRWPDELDGRPDGPEFTNDDLLDFHLLLRHDEEWSKRLAASFSDVRYLTS